MGEENVGVRVITDVGVIIAMTKKREIQGNRAQEMRESKEETEDKMMAGENKKTTFSLCHPLHSPLPPSAFLPSGICLFLFSSAPASPSSNPPPPFPKYVDGTLPQCQPSLSLSLSVCSHVSG